MGSEQLARAGFHPMRKGQLCVQRALQNSMLGPEASKGFLWMTRSHEQIVSQ